jgi:hypothetical protein
MTPVCRPRPVRALRVSNSAVGSPIAVVRRPPDSHCKGGLIFQMVCRHSQVVESRRVEDELAAWIKARLTDSGGREGRRTAAADGTESGRAQMSS